MSEARRPKAPAPSAEGLERRALRLEYATIAWNVGEAVFTIALGVAAASLALVSFGVDAIIEVFASAVVVWHLRGGRPDSPDRTRRALHLVSLAFMILAVALMFLGLRDLLGARRPDESWLGIAYLAVTAVVMFSLAVAKRRTAADLGSAPLRTEATVTFLDGALATATLLGLLLNATLGWWWADPAAALVIAVAASREALETWREADELSAPD